MRALVYKGPGEVEIAEEQAPLAHGEELVSVAFCGICGSDMHAFHGHDDRRPAPLILGHEAVGITEGGQRVVINPLVTCGQCEACKSGRGNLCPHRQILSMPPRQGAFAQIVRVPKRNLLAVPEGMSMERAALTEPLACGWHAVRLALRHSAAVEGSRPVVLGGGAIGLATALALRAHGAARVVIVEPNAARWPILRSAGKFLVLPPSDAASLSPNLIIDAHGSAQTRAAAVEMVAPGGVIVHVGLADNDPSIDIRRMTLQQITMVGAYTYTATEFAHTLSAIAAGRLGSLDWFEKRPLTDGPRAFADLASGSVASPKILLALD